MKNPFREEIEVEATTRYPDVRTLYFPLHEPVNYVPVTGRKIKQQSILKARYAYVRTETKIQHVYKFEGVEGR